MKILRRLMLVLILTCAAAFAAIWFLRPADVDVDAALPTLPHSAFSRFADVDGVRLHYQEKGTGAPLVLLHGYTSSAYTWRIVFEPLAERHRVIALDFKGFGLSGKPDGDYTRRAQSELLIRFLDHLKIEQAILCGSSMGAEVALNAARYHPTRVTKLILCDTTGVNVEGGSSVAPGFASWPVIGPALAAVVLTSDNIVRQGLKSNYYDQSKVTEECVAVYHRPLKTRGGQRAAFRARTQANLQPIEPELGMIQQPTLILWGSEDQIVPLAAGQRLNQLIGGSRLAVFEGCGHLPHEEKSERFLREVETFVAPAAAPMMQTLNKQ
jgi:pimeloyl-ACP methyl ester carboxylesterase